MIQSFGDKRTEDLYHGRPSRAVQRKTMLPDSRTPTHPGEVLLEEFLRPLDVSQVGLAQHVGIPVQRVNEIVRGKRGVSPQTAWLLAQALGTTPEFWLNLQSAYDLACSRPSRPVAPLAHTA